MGEIRDKLDEASQQFISESTMFFVATAPKDTNGHINLSPKGLDTFRVISPEQVAYLDYTGSGAETIAHIRENKRITVMFTAFSGEPNILRIYGRGRAVFPSDPSFKDLESCFEGCNLMGVRSIIDIEVSGVSSSCGFGVPLMSFVGNRSELMDWQVETGTDGLLKYQARKNQKSIDGLEAVPFVQAAASPEDTASPEDE